MANLKVSTARTRSFLMVQSADHISPLTGATVTVSLSKNGGAFGSPSGGATASEISNGWYSIALSTTDTNTFGDLDVHAAASSGGDPTDFQDQVVGVDFTDAVRLGLSALPNAAAGANTGLPIVGSQVPNANAGASSGLLINGSNSGAVTLAGLTTGITGNITGNLSGSVGSVGNVTGDVQGKVLGGGASTITGDGVQATLRQGQADLVWQSTRCTPETGTAQTAIAGSITLRAGASAVDSVFVGSKIAIFAGTGVGQCRVIISYTGSTKIAAVDQIWTTIPDNTSQYIILFDDAPACNNFQQVQSSLVAGNVNGSVQGNIVGNVNGRIMATNIAGGSIAAVGVQSDLHLWLGAAPASPNQAGVPIVDTGFVRGVQPNALIGGNYPANAQAAASSLTTNISGNLSGSVGSVTGSVGSVASNVTVGTNNDKTGYALTGGEHTQIASDVLDATAANHNTSGSVGNKINSAAAAGDPWTATIPGSYATGSAGQVIGSRIDAAISSRQATGNVTVGGYASGQDPASLVLDVSAASHNQAGSIGAKITSAASAGDPWSTSLPGSYAAGTAGAIVGGRLDAAVSSRQASFTVPANFGLLSVDASGRMVLQPTGLDPIVIETGLNARQALSVIASANAGVLTGATGTNIAIQAANAPTINRISAVVDANGDRNSVSLNLP
jgi:hypothetical protein